MKNLSSTDQEQILEIISNLKFFKNFSEYEKKRVVAHHAHIRSFNMGDYIVKEGGRDDAFFIILSGSVHVVKSGKSEPLATLGPGEFFGEGSFLTSRARISNVVANEPVVVFQVNKKLMESLGTDIREKIKDQILWRLLVRLDDMNDLIGRLSTVARFPT